MKKLLVTMACVALVSCGAETVVMLRVVGPVRVPDDIDTIEVTIKKGTEVIFPKDSRDTNAFKPVGGKLDDTKPTVAIVAGEVVSEGKITVLVTGKRNGVFKVSEEKDTLLTAETTTVLEMSLETP